MCMHTLASTYIHLHAYLKGCLMKIVCYSCFFFFPVSEVECIYIIMLEAKIITNTLTHIYTLLVHALMHTKKKKKKFLVANSYFYQDVPLCNFTVDQVGKDLEDIRVRQEPTANSGCSWISLSHNTLTWNNVIS